MRTERWNQGKPGDTCVRKHRSHRYGNLVRRVLQPPAPEDRGGPGRANVLLSLRDKPAKALSLGDHGLRLERAKSIGGWVLTSDRILLDDSQALAVKKVAPEARKVSISLATRVDHQDRSIAYATIAWVEGLAEGRMVDWAAKDLGARGGSPIRVEVLKPRKDGGYGTLALKTTVGAIVPMGATDPALVPVLEGVTGEDRMDDWDPPFPVDLSRVTPRDEEYWRLYRAAPRLFLPESLLKRSWGTDGFITGMWFPHGDRAAVERTLLESLAPEDSGISRVPLRDNAERAAQGSSDLGGLMLALGFFVVLMALYLAFSAAVLGIQSRSRDVALMRAVGLSEGFVKSMLLKEFALLSLVGSVLGVPLGLLFARWALAALAWLMPHETGFGLVPVSSSPVQLAGAWALAFGASLLGLIPALRTAVHLPAVPTLRGLPIEQARTARPPRGLWIAAGVCLLGLLGREPALRALAASAAVLLGGMACLFSLEPWASRRVPFRGICSGGWRPVALLVGAATLVLSVTAGSLRDANGDPGYDLVVATTVPVTVDLADPTGRKSLGFTDEEAYGQMTVVPFLRTPGEDASCLNLAKPASPRIVGVSKGSRPFATTPEGAWEELDRQGQIGLIGEADTVRWSLASDLGREYPVAGSRGRFVGLTHGSVLAGDLFVGERDFRRLFPHIDAPTLFLVRTPRPEQAAKALRRDLMADVRFAKDELRAIHQVRRAYLSLFAGLGLFALLLGVVGSVLMAMRRGFERRREFALLRCLGFSRARVGLAAILESIVAVLAGASIGLAAGGVGSTLGGGLAWDFAGISVLLVLATNLVACQFVASSVLRSKLVEALRTE